MHRQVHAMESAMADRWLSVEEMAEYLGVSRDTVYAWIAKKDMPAHKVGRFWKFKTEEVDEWVRSGKASGESDSAAGR
jgi:excisionase family DNA binding protein